MQWEFQTWSEPAGDPTRPFAVIHHDGLVITVVNNGASDALKVLWDEAVVADVDGVAFDVRVTSAPKRIPEGARAVVGLTGPRGDNVTENHRDSVRVAGGSQAQRQALSSVVRQVSVVADTRNAVRVPIALSLRETNPGATPSGRYAHTLKKAAREALQEEFHDLALTWMKAEAGRFTDTAQGYTGRSISVLLPMRDAGREIEYLFTFALEVSVAGVWDPPLRADR